MKFQYQWHNVGMNGRPSQDSLAVLEERNGHLRLALADGVGGQSGGREAAQKAVELWMSSEYPPELAMAETDSWLSRLRASGQTTAIYLHLSEDNCIGASVGDSQVWFQEANQGWSQLTEQQRPRPFVGSGAAIPTRFSRVLRSTGRILVCSDGLWRQVARETMLHLAHINAVDQLLLACQMPSSQSCADDVSFVVVHWDQL